LSTVYAQLAQGVAAEDIEFKSDNFFDFLSSQEPYTASLKYQENEQFWQQHYQHAVEPIQFYGQSTYYKTAKTTRITQYLTDETMALFDSHSLSCTPAVIFTTATFSFLRLVSGKSDLSVGVPLLNRGGGSFLRSRLY
jgi:hypothetical protein